MRRRERRRRDAMTRLIALGVVLFALAAPAAVVVAGLHPVAAVQIVSQREAAIEAAVAGSPELR